MQRCCQSVFVFSLILSTSVAAQTKTVTRADLLGTWVVVEDTTHYWIDTVQHKGMKVVSFLTLNADSTWTTAREVNGVRDEKKYGWSLDGAGAGTKGEWSLAGDTLKVPSARQTMTVAIQEGKLFVEGNRCTVLTRFDSAKPLPPPEGVLLEKGACTNYGKR